MKDRKAWHAAAHGVSESDTTQWLNNWATFSARRIYLRHFWTSLLGYEKKDTSMLCPFADRSWHFLAILSMINWHFHFDWKKGNVDFQVKMKSFRQIIYSNSHYQYYSWKMLQRKCQKTKKKRSFPYTVLMENSKTRAKAIYIYIYIHTHTHTHTHNPYYSRIPYCKFISFSLRFICNGKIHTPGPSARTLSCFSLVISLFKMDTKSSATVQSSVSKSRKTAMHVPFEKNMGVSKPYSRQM